MKKAALFDLDGVVVDTEPSYTTFWEGIGHDYLPNHRNFASEIKGHTLTYIFDTYFPNMDAAQENIKRRLVEHQQTMSYPYISGVMDFIQHLREKGIGTAVVTSSDCSKMESLYREHPEFIHCFDRIFTAEDALKSKPAPDGYLAAAAFFDLPPEQCVVFEDSFNGLKAGAASGAKVVGLTTSNRAEDIALYCDIVIPDFKDEKVLCPLFFF